MTNPVPVSKLIETVVRERPNARVDVDKPRNPDGEWMLDIASGRFRTTVAWRPSLGFGFFTSEEQGIGDRPDEIYRKAEDAYTRLCQLMERAESKSSLSSMLLGELRQLVGTPQTELAEKLDINQAAISRLENREDMLLGSLIAYIEAMGGELELRARFRDFEARIGPKRSTKRRARG